MTASNREPRDPWDAGASRQERIELSIERRGLDGLVAMTPENGEYLSGRPSTIATLWRLPGLVAVAVNAAGDLAVAAGDHEIDGYEAAFARFDHPLWIEHLDLGDGEKALAARMLAARPAGVLERPAQFESESMLDAVAAAAGAVAGRSGRMGLELASLPCWVVEGLRQRLTGIELVEASDIFADLRAIKDDRELRHLRLAAALTEIGIAGARDALQPGMSALAVTAAYQRAIWDAVAVEPRYREMRQAEGLVSVGDGGEPAMTGPGETVKLDMQVDVGGYHSDIGRTYALEPTEDQQTVYDALRGALDIAVKAIAPGVPFREVWWAGTAAMREAGFANYSRGHLGHSVGLAHNYEEPPFISADETRPMAENMVVSVELPYYLKGIGSFQMERMVIVGGSGCEILDTLPFVLDPTTRS